MAREEFVHNQLFTGEVHYAFRVAMTGEVNRGDLLMCKDGVWKAATATFDATAEYCIADETKTLEAGDTISCIKEGYFNNKLVKVAGAEVPDAMLAGLASKNIFLETVIEA